MTTVLTGAGWAVVEDQGGRPYMEDRWSAAEMITDHMLMFGVFDGHNGGQLATYCQSHVAEYIRREMVHVRPEVPLTHVLTTAIEKLDRVASGDSLLPKAKDVGSTACMALVTSDEVWFINVGDSRALIRDAIGVRQMTQDHKPTLQSESDRVRKHGGKLSNLDGSWRINGRLNLSRSIGDWSMRPFIISVPEITHHKRQHTSDKYVVLATDGLFDVMSNADIVRIIDTQPHTRHGVTLALRGLVAESRTRGSEDNITIIYIGIDMSAKTTSPHAKRK